MADLAKKMGDDSNEEGEAEEREDDDEPEQEVGPPLLTRLSKDAGQSLTLDIFMPNQFCVQKVTYDLISTWDRVTCCLHISPNESHIFTVSVRFTH